MSVRDHILTSREEDYRPTHMPEVGDLEHRVNPVNCRGIRRIDHAPRRATNCTIRVTDRTFVVRERFRLDAGPAGVID